MFLAVCGADGFGPSRLYFVVYNAQEKMWKTGDDDNKPADACCCRTNYYRTKRATDVRTRHYFVCIIVFFRKDKKKKMEKKLYRDKRNAPRCYRPTTILRLIISYPCPNFYRVSLSQNRVWPNKSPKCVC